MLVMLSVSVRRGTVDTYACFDEFMKLKPAMFHLTDVERLDDEYDKHLHIGDGLLDMKRVLSIIPENATITLETNKDSKEQLDDFKCDIEMIKKLDKEKKC